MDITTLKKFLAGLCIAGLLSGAGLTVSGCERQAQSS
ncbi:MAG: SbtA family thio(seleno)oxazole RiPP natural product precursor [bacterium]